MPLVAAAGIGAAGSIFSGLLGANAANKAANAQVNAANASANLQYGNEQQALGDNRQAYTNSLNMSLPFVQSGQSALANLDNLMGILPQQGQGSQVNAPQGQTGIGTPRFLGDIYTNHGNAYKYAGQQGGRDVYQPYTSNSALANDRTKWMTAGAGGANDFTGGVSADWKPGAPTGTQSGLPSVSTPNLSSLVNPDLGATGSLAKPWDQTFSAPTGLTEQNDPGFQARLKLGSDALQRSAAAKGGLLTGGFAKDLNSFAQDYASNEYGNTYGRAFNEYATRYNQFQQGRTDLYNRLANMAGQGQVSAQQLGLMGQNASGLNANILLNSGAQIGQDLNNAAAARASGYVGAANAYGGMFGGAANSLNTLSLLKLLGSGGGGGVFNANPTGGMSSGTTTNDGTSWYG